MTIEDDKADLRVRARQVRAKAHAENGAAAAAIADIGLGFLDFTAGAVVSGYAAMRDELDPGPLLARLQDAGMALALPVTIGRGRPLIFRSWRPGDEMGTGFMGIAEPLPSAIEAQPDVLLVPLLAFDDRGFRLGYGGGHYDRTLGELRKFKPVVAVGLAFDEQKLDAVPQGSYDQHLDWMLTPSGARRCVGMET